MPTRRRAPDRRSPRVEKPAPAAVPLTAVISTASIRAKRRDRAVQVVRDALDECGPRSGAAAKDFRSPPAQKKRPVSGEHDDLRRVGVAAPGGSASSRVMVSFMPLAASGRLRVMRVMAPDCSNLMRLVFGHTWTLASRLQRFDSPPASLFTCVWQSVPHDGANPPRLSRSSANSTSSNRRSHRPSTVCRRFPGWSGPRRTNSTPSTSIRRAAIWRPDA